VLRWRKQVHGATIERSCLAVRGAPQKGFLEEKQLWVARAL
jgi:hypothetical protein